MTVDSSSTWSEADRLSTVHHYRILDSEAEAPFDELAELASLVCGTPIAAINILDEEREWSKARFGTALSDVPRASSLCDVTVTQGEVVVVADTTTDERFRNAPLVTGEPYIRFYAGAPLVTPNGQVLGTICVADVEPRQLERAQIDALAVLGRHAMRLLELRRAAAEQVRSTAELRQEYAYALRTQEHLTQFMATIAQEIRAPANSIGTAADLLLATALRGGGRRQGELLQSSATGLRALANALTELAKLEGRHLRLAVGEFDLRALIDESLAQLVGVGRFATLEIASTVHANVPRTVRGDRAAIRQVLINVLSHAMKRGDLALDVDLVEHEAHYSNIRFSISSGEAGSSDDSAARSDGFELAVAKHLVELMEGRLETSEEDGRGSTLWFSLRLANPLQRPQRGASKNARILIAGVPGTAANAARQALERAGWTLREAATGREAFATLRNALIEGAPFDVVLVWTPLPDMPALEFAQTAAGDEALATLRIVLVDDAPIPLPKHAFDTVLVPPLETQRLVDVVRAALGGEPNDSHSADAAGNEPLAKSDRSDSHSDLDFDSDSDKAAVQNALRDLEDDLSPESVRRLCGIFLSDSEVRLRRLASAIETNDRATVRAQAHAARGSIANFNARHAVEAADALEAASDNGDVRSAYAGLEREIHELQTIIRAHFA